MLAMASAIRSAARPARSVTRSNRPTRTATFQLEHHCSPPFLHSPQQPAAAAAAAAPPSRSRPACSTTTGRRSPGRRTWWNARRPRAARTHAHVPKPQFHSLFLSEAAPKASSTPGSLTGRARTVASWPYRYVLANAFFALHAKRQPICASLSLDHSQLRPPTHAAAHPGAARSARIAFVVGG